LNEPEDLKDLKL